MSEINLSVSLIRLKLLPVGRIYQIFSFVLGSNVFEKYRNMNETQRREFSFQMIKKLKLLKDRSTKNATIR